MRIRQIEPADYAVIIPVMNDWWSGRAVRDMLPKLFFVHFRDTSFAAEQDGAVVGFLVGFLSQTFLDEAYIHFVGVHPAFRQQRVGQRLYDEFFRVVRRAGRHTVRCVTSPVNSGSIAFHTRMGFAIESQDVGEGGVAVTRNYDGLGNDRVLFVKHLPA